MTCEKCRELFVDARYGELGVVDGAAFKEHLSSCTACASDYERMQRTLEIMDRRLRSEPGEAFWASYWENLHSKMESEKETSPLRTHSPKMIRFRPALIPAWAYGVAAVLLVALGIYLGRSFLVRQAPDTGRRANVSIVGTGADSAFASRQAVERQSDEYLERSKVLLIGLVNAPAGVSSTSNLARQQHISRELIRQADYLKTTLKERDQQHLRQLIGDLEVVLMQLANYSVENGVPLVELVKQGVDKKSILLKINVEQIRALGSRPGPAAKTPKNNEKSKI